jgi:hypothetical protein
MNITKDLYTVFIFSEGYRFYFKNNQLHREAGLAIIGHINARKKNYEDLYVNLGDETLYKKIFIKSRNKKQDFFIFKFMDSSEVIMTSPIKYIYDSDYYLNGIKFDGKEFTEHKIIKFKKELSNELSVIQSNKTKKPKV